MNRYRLGRFCLWLAAGLLLATGLPPGLAGRRAS